MNAVPVVEPADKSPAAGQLAHREHEFVLVFFQRQIHGVIFRIPDARAQTVRVHLWDRFLVGVSGGGGCGVGALSGALNPGLDAIHVDVNHGCGEKGEHLAED